jgi:hypothetical protein
MSVCSRCNEEPCNCIASSSPGGPKRVWLLQTCSEPGCTVVIRSLPGEQDAIPICKWHKGGHAYNSDQIQGRPNEGPLISKDEFGQDLFDAIKCQSAMREAFKTARLFRAKGKVKAADEAEQAVVDLQKQLETILKKNTIAPEDIQRLLAIT